jgi:hypothetical protein
VWTFPWTRKSCTGLPDGRVVCIAGEHEDYYGPDFYIYSDVVVFDPDSAIVTLAVFGSGRNIYNGSSLCRGYSRTLSNDGA